MWTRFFDMNSGGTTKLGADVIWVEAKEEDATQIFEAVFHRDPTNVTCYCCGPDYSINEWYKPNFANGDWIVSADDIARLANERGLSAPTAKAPQIAVERGTQ